MAAERVALKVEIASDEDHLVERLRVQDGWVEMTDEPGLGLVVTRDVIRYLHARA